MTKKANAERREQLVDPVTIEEAFNILLPIMKKPLAVAARLNNAIVTGDVQLWGNGEKVHENFDFERHLRIAAKRKEGGDWTAEMELRWAVDDFDTTAWTLSRAEVTALLDAEPPRAGRKRGRKVKFNWDTVVAEVIRRVHQEGLPENDSKFANKLFKWALDKFDKDTPTLDTIRKKVPIWFSHLRRLGN
jgi:hypothetical protein